MTGNLDRTRGIVLVALLVLSAVAIAFAGGVTAVSDDIDGGESTVETEESVGVTDATLDEVTGDTVLGDVTQTGEVTLTDAILIQEEIAGVREGGEFFEPAGDLNRDGDIGLTDGILVQEKVAGILDEGEIEVSNLDGPAEATSGEEITVSADLENLGEEGALQDIEFRIAPAGEPLDENATVAEEFVDMAAPGVENPVDRPAETTITFEDIAVDLPAGEYEHGIFSENDNVTGALTVEPGVTFDVSNLQAPDEVAPDDIIDVSADITAIDPDAVDVTVVDSTFEDGEAAALVDFLETELDDTGFAVRTVDSDDLLDHTDRDVYVINELAGSSPTAFLDELDDDQAVIFLDQHGDDADGVESLVDDRTDPEAFDSTSASDGTLGAFGSELHIEADHPLFDGVGDPGDVVDIRGASGQQGDRAWFDEYSGETLGEIADRTDDDTDPVEPDGPAVAVDDDANEVLLSAMGRTASTNHGDYEDPENAIMLNAVEYAAFEQAGLEAPDEPGDAEATQEIEWRFDGDVERTQNVTLSIGESETVTFEDIDLGDIPRGDYEHGVFSDDDSETATISLLEPVFFEVTGFDGPASTAQGDEVSVSANVTNTLPPQPPEEVDLAVVDGDFGDEGAQALADFLDADLDDDTYTVSQVLADDLLDEVDDHDLFIVNEFAGGDDPPDEEQVSDFLDALDDEQGAIHLNIADEATYDSNAVFGVSEARGDPANVEFTFGSAGDGPVDLHLEADHPLFDGVGDEGDVLTYYDAVFDGDSFDAYATFDGYTGETLASVSPDGEPADGPAIGIDDDRNEILLSSQGVQEEFHTFDTYTDDANAIMLNAVEYARTEFLATTPLGTDATGTQSVEYRLEDEVLASQDVSLDAGESQLVEFDDVSVPDDAPVGDVVHGVFSEDDGDTAPVTVLPSDAYLLSELDPETAEVTEGDDPIDVSVDVENVGGVTGEQDLVLEVVENGTGDVVYDDTIEDVVVDPGETVTETFEDVPAGDLPAGTYTHTVTSDDDEISGTLAVLEPVFFNVTDLDAPATVTQGDEIDVSANVTNTVPPAEGVEEVDVAVVDSEFDDSEAGAMADRLADDLGEDFVVSEVFTDDLLDDVDEYDVFVVNEFADASAEDFLDALSEDQAAIYLDQSGFVEGTDAVGTLSDVRDDPETFADGFADNDPIEMQLDADHPIFEGVGDEGEVVTYLEFSTDFAFFDDYSGDVLGQVVADGAAQGPAVGVSDDANEVLLASAARGEFAGDDLYTDEENQIMLNAIEYAAFEQADLIIEDAFAPDATATQEITYEFEGEGVVRTKEVTLDAGESQTVTFEDVLVNVESGTYEHGVYSQNDSATAAIEVLEPVFFEVTDLEAPAATGQGDEITVSADVSNTAPPVGDPGVFAAPDATDTQEIEYRLDGEVLASQNLTLDAGQTETVTFTADVGVDAGEYEHGVYSEDDNETAELSVRNVAFADQALGADAGGDGAVLVENVSADASEAVAVTYTDGDDEIVAGLTVLDEDTEGEHVVVEIEDTGGFPGEHTAHVVLDPSEETTIGEPVSGDTAASIATQRSATVFDAEVSIADQVYEDSTTEVVVDTTALQPTEEYVVVIHEDTEGLPVLGSSDDLTGPQDDLTVTVDELTSTTDVVAMLHFADADDAFGPSIPALDGEAFEPVTDTSTVEIQQAASGNVDFEDQALGTDVDGEPAVLVEDVEPVEVVTVEDAFDPLEDFLVLTEGTEVTEDGDWLDYVQLSELDGVEDGTDVVMDATGADPGEHTAVLHEPDETGDAPDPDAPRVNQATGDVVADSAVVFGVEIEVDDQAYEDSTTEVVINTSDLQPEAESEYVIVIRENLFEGDVLGFSEALTGQQDDVVIEIDEITEPQSLVAQLFYPADNGFGDRIDRLDGESFQPESFAPVFDRFDVDVQQAAGGNVAFAEQALGVDDAGETAVLAEDVEPVDVVSVEDAFDPQDDFLVLTTGQEVEDADDIVDFVQLSEVDGIEDGADVVLNAKNASEYLGEYTAVLHEPDETGDAPDPDAPRTDEDGNVVADSAPVLGADLLIEDQVYDESTDTVAVDIAAVFDEAVDGGFLGDTEYVVGIYDGEDSDGELLGVSEVLTEDNVEFEVDIDELEVTTDIAGVLHFADESEPDNLGEPIRAVEGDAFVDFVKDGDATVSIVEGQVTIVESPDTAERGDDLSGAVEAEITAEEVLGPDTVTIGATLVFEGLDDEAEVELGTETVELGAGETETVTFQDLDALPNATVASDDEPVGLRVDTDDDSDTATVDLSHSIQSAVNFADTEDEETVEVLAGTYEESVSVGVEGLTLESAAGPAETTIEGDIFVGNDPSSPESADGTVIDGFEIVEPGLSGDGQGIGVTESSDVVIQNNEFEGFRTQISLDFAGGDVENITIQDSTFAHVGEGDAEVGTAIGGTENADGLDILANEFVNNRNDIGLASSTTDVTIEDNSFEAGDSESYISNRNNDDPESATILAENTFDPDAVTIEEFGDDPDRDQIVPETAVNVVNVDQQTGFFEVQPAVDGADDGDRLEVRPGTYQEDVTIDGIEDLSVEGLDDPTIVGEIRIGDPADTQGADGTELVGLTVEDPQPAETTRGVGITESNDVVLDNVTVEGFTTGLSLQFSGATPENVAVTESTFVDSFVAVGSTEDVDGLTVTDTTFEDMERSGVDLGDGVADVTIEDNTFDALIEDDTIVTPAYVRDFTEETIVPGDVEAANTFEQATALIEADDDEGFIGVVPEFGDGDVVEVSTAEQLRTAAAGGFLGPDRVVGPGTTILITDDIDLMEGDGEPLGENNVIVQVDDVTITAQEGVEVFAEDDSFVGGDRGFFRLEADGVTVEDVTLRYDDEGEGTGEALLNILGEDATVEDVDATRTSADDGNFAQVVNINADGAEIAGSAFDTEGAGVNAVVVDQAGDATVEDNSFDGDADIGLLGGTAAATVENNDFGPLGDTLADVEDDPGTGTVAYVVADDLDLAAVNDTNTFEPRAQEEFVEFETGGVPIAGDGLVPVVEDGQTISVSTAEQLRQAAAGEFVSPDRVVGPGAEIVVTDDITLGDEGVAVTVEDVTIRSEAGEQYEVSLAPDSPSSEKTFRVNADGVTLQDLTVERDAADDRDDESGFAHGVVIRDRDGGEISGVTVDSVDIVGSEFDDENNRGLQVLDGTGATAADATDITVIDSTVTGFDGGLSAAAPYGGTVDGVTVQNNEIGGHSVGLDVSTLGADFESPGGEVTAVTVEDNDFDSFEDGAFPVLELAADDEDDEIGVLDIAGIFQDDSNQLEAGALAFADADADEVRTATEGAVEFAGISADIQSSVDIGADEDTVEVLAGTYEESVSVAVEGLTLESAAGPAETTVEGQVTTTAANVELSGFTVENPDGDRGIRVTGDGTGVLIQDNTVTNVNTADDADQARGIVVGGLDNGDSADGVEIRNNTVTNIEGADADEEQVIGIQILEESEDAGPIENVVVDGNTIADITDTRSTVGVNFNGNIEGDITNNDISELNTDGEEGTGVTQAIALNEGGNAASAPQNVLIEDNSISNLETEETDNFAPATHITLEPVDDVETIDITNNDFTAVADDESYLIDRADDAFDLQTAIDENTFDPDAVEISDPEDALVPETAVNVVNVDQQTGFFEVQPAVDGANVGDRLEVRPGTYEEEDIRLNTDGITLTSADPADPAEIQDEGEGGDILKVDNDDIVVSDLVLNVVSDEQGAIDDAGGQAFTLDNSEVLVTADEAPTSLVNIAQPGLTITESTVENQLRLQAGATGATVQNNDLENINLNSDALVESNEFGGEFVGVTVSGSTVVEDADIVDNTFGGEVGVALSDHSSNVEIQGNSFEGLDAGVFVFTGSEAPGDGNLVTENEFTDNDVAVSVAGEEFGPADATVVDVNENNIDGNAAGAVNEGDGTLDATLNWWGDDSGPSGEGPGTGDSVSENVDFDPWLDDEFAVGEPVTDDLSVEFTDSPVDAERETDVTATAEVERDLVSASGAEVTVEYLVDGEVLDEETVTVTTGESETVTFEDVTVPGSTTAAADDSPETIDQTVRIVDAAASDTADLDVTNPIQQAVDFADAEGEETVTALAGTYEESVTVGVEGLTLEGPNAGIHGDSEDRGSEATITGGISWDDTNDVTVDGLEVEDEVGDGAGVIELGQSTGVIGDNAVIRNNVITADPVDDIRMTGVLWEGDSEDELFVENNLITQEASEQDDPGEGAVDALNHNEADIGLWEVTDNTLATEGAGFVAGGGDTSDITAELTGNEFTDVSEAFPAVSLTDGDSIEVSLEENTFDGAPAGIFLGDGVDTDNGDSVDITNNDFIGDDTVWYVEDNSDTLDLDAVLNDQDNTFDPAAVVFEDRQILSGGTVSGDVFVDDGGVDQDVDVELTFTDDEDETVTTTTVTVGEGQSAQDYSVGVPGPEDYTVSAEVVGDAADDWRIDTADVLLFVEPGDELTDIDFELVEIENPAFTGVIEDDNGDALADREVTFTVENGDTDEVTVSTDEFGEYLAEVDVEDGDYDITASADGFSDDTVEGVSLAGDTVAEGVDFTLGVEGALGDTTTVEAASIAGTDVRDRTRQNQDVQFRTEIEGDEDTDIVRIEWEDVEFDGGLSDQNVRGADQLSGVGVSVVSQNSAENRLILQTDQTLEEVTDPGESIRFTFRGGKLDFDGVPIGDREMTVDLAESSDGPFYGAGTRADAYRVVGELDPNVERSLEQDEAEAGETVDVTVTAELPEPMNTTLIETYDTEAADSSAVSLEYNGEEFLPFLNEFDEEGGVFGAAPDDFPEEGPGTLAFNYEIELPADIDPGEEFGFEAENSLLEIEGQAFDIGGDDTITIVEDSPEAQDRLLAATV